MTFQLPAAESDRLEKSQFAPKGDLVAAKKDDKGMQEEEEEEERWGGLYLKSLQYRAGEEGGKEKEPLESEL